jgi:site-specific DNA recombinase
MPKLIEKAAETHVVLYARVSTGMQAEEGLSIAAQLAEMREYAAQRGWIVAAEFVDAGETGRTLDRPGFKDLEAAIEQGACNVVLVHELSRLSRSVFDTFAFFEILGKHDVGFASVKEPQFDLSTPTGRLLLTFIAAINQYYVDILRLHTKKSKRQRARQGLYNASTLPYGYRHAGDPRTPPVIVEEEAKAALLAFERYATGRYSYQGVADVLNDAGHHTRRGRRFSKDTVADMLRNPFYAGKVVYKEGKRGDVGEVYDGLHEPLVSESIWEATVRVRQRHHHASRDFQHKVLPYLLSRVSRCHVCGRRLRAQSKGDAYKYYREMSYARGYLDCPNAQIGVRAEKLHAQINAIVRQLHLPSDWQEELSRIVGDDDERATLDNRRARLIARRRRLKEAYVYGDFDEDEDIYRRELDRIRRELETLPSTDDLLHIRHAADLLGSLADVWDEADPADQRDLIRLMLREVHVDVVQGRVLFLRPIATFIPLFRSMPILRECGLGTFAPVWRDGEGDLTPVPELPALKAVPRKPVGLPFLPTWPWEPDPTHRISRSLSSALKARRKAGCSSEIAVSVPRAGVLPVLLDGRKWPGASLEKLSLEEALAKPKGSLSFIATPLAVQESDDPEGLAEAVFRVLDEAGHWHLVDVVPASMPGHWVFAFFPEAWSHVEGSLWRAYDFYNILRHLGFEVEQREHTFRQPVSLRAALKIARRRPGVLAALPDEIYEAGLQRLEAAVEERGADSLEPSEVTVVEVTAVKGKGRKGGKTDAEN